MNAPDTLLLRLADVIDSRRSADPQTSYVARLMHKGDDAILKKIAEEAGEVLLAAKDVRAGKPVQAVINETADLWFHSMVLLSHLGVSPQDVINELARREGLSGLEEKARRPNGCDNARQE